MLFGNLVQPIDARIASLKSLFQMRAGSHVLVPWPMKFDARFLQQLLQIQFAPFLAPSSPGLGRQGLPSGRVLFLTVLRSPAHRDAVGVWCQNPANRVGVVIYLFRSGDDLGSYELSSWRIGPSLPSSQPHSHPTWDLHQKGVHPNRRVGSSSWGWLSSSLLSFWALASSF